MRSAPIALLAACAALGSCARACRPAVPILNYHSIGDAADPFAVSAKDFTGQLDFLRAEGFHTVSLHELFEHEQRGAPLPARPIVVTFDDGFLDNLALALPLLQARGLKATFFVVTGFLADDEAHRRTDERGRKYLLWSEVYALASAGMEIGSHSTSHRRLPDLPAAEIEAEARASREVLQARLGRPVEFFAFPFNSKRGEARQAVKDAGYRGAVAGVNGSADPFELYRIGAYKSMTVDDLKTRLR